MLTRLEVNGFKNLVNFALDFGPYTCIAGPNGVGKSNIFDAIKFLSLLTDHTINQAALRLRNVAEDTGDISDLFFSGGGAQTQRIEFAVEMLVDREVSDDFGRTVEPSSSFLRYEVAFRHIPPSAQAGPLGGLRLEREELRPITTGRASRHLKFPHNKSKFRDSVVYNNRHSQSGYVSTHADEKTGQAAITVHQDGGSYGRGRPAPAEGATRTIIGTENTAATPTILAARREMQNWRILALEPSIMRRPDRFTDEPGITANGGRIPATLQHLAGSVRGEDADNARIFEIVASRLADFVPVRTVRVLRDDVRQLLSLEMEEPSGVRLGANSISDGTLRFLALVAIEEASNTSGLYCMEEPENGIHPQKLSAMNQLLLDIAVDPQLKVDLDNPLRQVIVTTHSPYFVQLQNRHDLVMAKEKATLPTCGETVQHLKCHPYAHSWRCSGDESDCIDFVALQSYLLPPNEAQIAFPPDFWART